MKEKFMIGDSGANVLGAVIGLGLVLGLSFWWRLGVLIFLVFLTALSEKFSFSRVIEGNRVLNWLDELGRKRRDTA
jgi:UDP-N-acetylmuramyl pentapeptide phosphotransferase/UDP-N-acetylglucosamine-1-phosphate transferase